MAQITLTKSTSGKYFTITDPTGVGTIYMNYPCNSCYLTVNGNNAQLYLIASDRKIMDRVYSDVINGDTATAFANIGALATYINANCFV